MKIGILTQPLTNNYGGLIQAFALKKTLEKHGHNVYVINRVGFLRRNQKLSRKILSNAKKILFSVLGKKSEISKDIVGRVNINCTNFVNRYIKDVSKDIKTVEDLCEYTKEMCFEGYIVGSDQVWRPNYSPCIENYFLDFCEEQQVKRVAYAASFGFDQWEFTPKETKICSALAKKFDGLSVREDSGVVLCKTHLGVDAKHVLDPTMLLEKEEYEDVVNKENEPESNGNLFYYFLDDNAEKQNLIRAIEHGCNKVSFNCMPSKKIKNGKEIKNIEDYIYPSPTKWLRSFMDADMVVTDSFHGTVFSIIFNKPFWVIYNAHRGNTRFDSLLRLFGLDERIIDISDYSKIDFNKKFDWDRVNSIRTAKKQEALDFLTNNLNR